MRRRSDPKLEALSRVPLFRSLGKRSLAEVGSIADEVPVPKGRALIREGQPGRQFFVLLAGEVDVRRGGRKVNTLRAGDFFGEMALVSNRSTNATVTTTVDSRVVVITRPSFRRLLRDNPTVQMNVIDALVARIPGD